MKKALIIIAILSSIASAQVYKQTWKQQYDTASGQSTFTAVARFEVGTSTALKDIGVVLMGTGSVTANEISAKTITAQYLNSPSIQIGGGNNGDVYQTFATSPSWGWFQSGNPSALTNSSATANYLNNQYASMYGLFDIWNTGLTQYGSIWVNGLGSLVFNTGSAPPGSGGDLLFNPQSGIIDFNNNNVNNISRCEIATLVSPSVQVATTTLENRLNQVQVSTSTSKKSFTKIVGFTSDCDYICTGTSDNVKIQQAINSLAISSGGCVILREGNYMLEDTLQIDLTHGFHDIEIRGQGMATVLYWADYTDTSKPMFHIKRNNIRLQNFKTVTSHDYKNMTLKVESCSGFSADNCTFIIDTLTNGDWYMWFDDTVSYSEITNCELDIRRGIAFYMGGDNIYIVDNYIHGYADVGTVQTLFFLASDSKYFLLENNVIENLPVIQQVSEGNVIIKGNIMKGFDTGIGLTPYCIGLGGGSATRISSGNIVSDNIIFQFAYGIKTVSSYVNIYDTIISNNQIHKCGTALELNNCVNTLIEGNDFTDSNWDVGVLGTNPVFGINIGNDGKVLPYSITVSSLQANYVNYVQLNSTTTEIQRRIDGLSISSGTSQAVIDQLRLDTATLSGQIAQEIIDRQNADILLGNNTAYLQIEIDTLQKNATNYANSVSVRIATETLAQIDSTDATNVRIGTETLSGIDASILVGTATLLGVTNSHTNILNQIQIDTTTLALKDSEQDIRLNQLQIDTATMQTEYNGHVSSNNAKFNDIRISTDSLDQRKMDKTGGTFSGDVAFTTMTAEYGYFRFVTVTSETVVSIKSTDTVTNRVFSQWFPYVEFLSDINLMGNKIYNGTVVDVGIQTSTSTLQDKNDQQDSRLNQVITDTTNIVGVNSNQQNQINQLILDTGAIAGVNVSQQNQINSILSSTASQTQTIAQLRIDTGTLELQNTANSNAIAQIKIDTGTLVSVNDAQTIRLNQLQIDTATLSSQDVSNATNVRVATETLTSRDSSIAIGTATLSANQIAVMIGTATLESVQLSVRIGTATLSSVQASMSIGTNTLVGVDTSLKIGTATLDANQIAVRIGTGTLEATQIAVRVGTGTLEATQLSVRVGTATLASVQAGMTVGTNTLVGVDASIRVGTNTLSGVLTSVQVGTTSLQSIQNTKMDNLTGVVVSTTIRDGSILQQDVSIWYSTHTLNVVFGSTDAVTANDLLNQQTDIFVGSEIFFKSWFIEENNDVSGSVSIQVSTESFAGVHGVIDGGVGSDNTKRMNMVSQTDSSGTTSGWTSTSMGRGCIRFKINTGTNIKKITAGLEYWRANK